MQKLYRRWFKEFEVARRPYVGDWIAALDMSSLPGQLECLQNISKTTKTKQVKHLWSKINLAQQYYADKLYIIIQTPTDDMIADGLTKPKSPYTYATFEANRIGVYALPI